MSVLPSATLCPHDRDGLVYYTFPSLDAIPFLRHGFSTRLGGVSEGIYSSMDLSFTRGDDPDKVRENFRRFCDAIGSDYRNVVISAQTHTTNLYRATAADRGRGITFDRGYTDVDGLITDEPDVVLCAQFADCVPLFFADPVRRVVAVSHAGWRGTVGAIARCTVESMVEDYGCRAEDILAGIGPSIGRCCFEIDRPVYDEFCKAGMLYNGAYTDDGGGKYHIDLWEVNRQVMIASGILPEHINVTDLCTRCHPDIFWSHRYCGGERGSLAAFIALRDV